MPPGQARAPSSAPLRQQSSEGPGEPGGGALRPHFLWVSPMGTITASLALVSLPGARHEGRGKGRGEHTLAGKHSECWRRLGPAFAIGPQSSGQVPACTYCFHWPRASWWSVEQSCSFPFTSIPPGLLRTTSWGSSFNNASTGLRGEARGSQHPPIPQVYHMPARGAGPGAAGGSGERRQPIPGISQADGLRHGLAK